MRLLGLLCGVAFASVAVAEEVVVRVVDAEGKPVAGCIASVMWLEGNATNAATTGEDGRLRLPVRPRGRPVAVIVKGPKNERGVLSRFSAASFGKERTLRLEPLVTVQGRFTCSERKVTPPWTNVYADVQPGNIRVARCMSDHAKFSFRLPPGDYRFHMYGTDVQPKDVDRFVEAEGGDVDFGAIDLAATPLARLYGKKPPPLKVTAARGVKANVRWKDFKGKFVLVEFWGFW